MANDYQSGQRGIPRGEDIELASAVSRNDPNAVSQLFAFYNEPIARYIRTVAPHLSDNDTQDIVQETFIAVLHSIKDYRGESSLSTWVLRISYFKSIDFLRRHKSLEKSESPLSDVAANEDINFVDPAGSAEDKAISNEEIQLIYKGLASLPEEQRQVIYFRYVMGMRVEDVAETMKLSRRMVELHITRGRSALRKWLSAQGIHG